MGDEPGREEEEAAGRRSYAVGIQVTGEVGGSRRCDTGLGQEEEAGVLEETDLI